MRLAGPSIHGSGVTALERIGIVADDLTGALDAGAPFAARSFRVELTLPGGKPSPAAEVVLISTDTRDAGLASAATAAAAAAEQLREWGAVHVLVKIDSTLRGHPEAIAQAVAQVVSPASPIVICSAYPDLGRTICAGRLRVDGADRGLDLRDVFAGAVLSDSTELAGRLGHGRTRREIIVDAETDDDLDRIIDAGLGSSVLVGSAGLATALARKLACTPAPRELELPHSPGAPVLVIGTRHPVTQTQLSHLRDHRRVQFDPDGDTATGETVYDRDGPPLLLRFTDRESTPELVDGALTRAAVQAVEQGASHLLLSGGATAAAVMSALGSERLEVLGECLPGIAVSRDPERELVFITKSGGFGAPTALDTIVRALTHREGDLT